MLSPRTRARSPERHSGSAREYVFHLGAVVLTVFAISVAKPVLVPLALAILLAFILSPVVSLGQRVGLGRVPSTLLTLVLAGAVAAALATMVGFQVARLAGELPSHQADIEAKLDGIRGAGSGGPFSRVIEMVRELAEEPADPGTDADPPLRVQVDEGSSLSRTIEPALRILEPVATAGLVVVLMVFIMLGREDLRSRFLATLGQGRLIGTVRVLEDSADRIGRYLLFQLLVNASLGALLAVGLYLMGVPYAPLWGFLTALLRFIPFVGTWIAVILPLSLSFATAPDWHQPAMVLAYFAGLDLITANLVEPLLFGHHTGVSPIALLVAAAFWAWVWGPVGLLLSTPLTVCLAVLGQHVPGVQSLGLLLGDKPALAPHVEYYQRVLTDGSRAGEEVAVAAAANGAVPTFDDMLIPAVALTHLDRGAALLSAAEEADVREAVLSAIAPVLRRGGAPPPAVGGAVVLGIPSHHELEEVPLHMLAAARGDGRVEVLSTRLLPSEVVARVAASAASVVVISNLPPGGLPQTAYLSRLLRRQYPALTIIVARWGGGDGYDDRLVRMRKAGASYLTTTLGQTLAQIQASADREGAEAVPPAPLNPLAAPLVP